MKNADKALYARLGIDHRRPRHERYAEALMLIYAKSADRSEIKLRLVQVFEHRKTDVASCKACRHGWRCKEHRHINAVLEEFALSELSKLK